jgi:hypothetical protein
MARLNCVALFALGCAVHDADAQQVRDSAGVRIVSYARGDVPKQRWSLDPKPLLEIGGTTHEGPTAFADIRGVVLMSDGHVAVANQQPSEIRLFTASGQFIRALGRNGQGPGEFNRVLWRLLRSGDTLIGVDNSMRAQVFDPSGELRRSLPRPRPPASQGNPARLAFGADGSAIVQAVELPAQTTSPEAAVFLRLWRESSDGERYVDLLRVLAYRPIVARGPTPAMVVFGPRSAVAVNLTRICVGYTSAFTVTCYNHAGQAVVVVRRHVTPRAIKDEDRQFFRDAYLAANKGAPATVIAAIKESNRLTQFAGRAPAFSRVLLAMSGELWVSEFDRSENSLGPPAFRSTRVPLRWSVFGVDGTWLSDVLLPARFTPHEMGFDYVIGTSLDADDVERVTKHRIRR